MSELELAALAAAAVPDLQVRGIRGHLLDQNNGQWLTFVDAQGQSWLAWAPSTVWSERVDARFTAVNSLLEDAAKRDQIPFSPAVPVGRISRSGGGEAFVLTHPGGSELQAEDLAGSGLLPKSLGGALAALHELPSASYAQATRQRASVEVTRTALTQLVEAHSSAIPARLRSRWLDTIDEDSLWRFEPVPLHGSLDATSVYAAPGGAVVGMAPFSSAAVGDPAQDVVWLMYHASDEFLETFEAAYARGRHQSDLHLLTRAQLLSELETLRWYSRAVEAEDRSWRREGLKALRDLDADLGDHRLVASRPEVVEITFTADEEPLMRLQASELPEGSSSKPSRSEPVEAVCEPGSQTEVISQVCDLETGPYQPFPSPPAAETLGASDGEDSTGSIELP